MGKLSEITCQGMSLPQGNLVEVTTFWAVDTNQWFLFERNSLGEWPMVNP